MILLGKARRELKNLLKDQCNSITIAKAMKLLKDLEKELEKRAEEDYSTCGWAISDFETQARRLEADVFGESYEYDPEDHRKAVPEKFRLYLRSTFRDTLDRMVSKACDLNWETVEYYLDQYCHIARNDIEEEVA